MTSITPIALQELLLQNKPLQLVDVREAFERSEFHIGGIHIPLSEIMEQSHLIETDKPVVIYCKKGIRSMIAIQRLELRLKHAQLINLQGGILAWQSMIDDLQ